MSVNVIVLGGSGMLGSMVVDYLSTKDDVRVSATVRSKRLLDIHLDIHKDKKSDVSWKLFDADGSGASAVGTTLGGHDWVINAIGITKPLIKDDDAFEIRRAVKINSLLPYSLAEWAEKARSRVLQIATDCVYSGIKGDYTEDDDHDPLDVYGKTKSLGEVHSPNVSHLRCSIVGPEPKEHKFLLDWLLGQSKGARVSGYVNHRWNGVTTLHFAKICHGIITNNIVLPHLQHIVPKGEVTKCDLLRSFAKSYRREDITIKPGKATIVVDRTLSTKDQQTNSELWRKAGYSEALSIPEMVEELSSFSCRSAGH